MNDMVREIRGVMIPVTNGRVLLPNATVAEVITFATTEPVPNSPKWLMGKIGWRGWRLPLFSFSMMTGIADKEGQLNVRVAVLKALSGNAKMPFMAMMTQGFPRLTTISHEVLLPSGEEGDLPEGVQSSVMVRDDHAVIPDLQRIERMVADALGV